MTTPLYPTFKKRVDDAFEQVIKQQVTPWTFMAAGPPFSIKSFDGREITYQGIAFAGSHREVFGHVISSLSSNISAFLKSKQPFQ